MNLCLANADYLRHTTNEGNELQEGLRHAGWTLCGVGYDGLKNVGAILDRYKPEAVFVQDCRDFLPESAGCFRKDIGFERIELLGKSGVPAFTVLKDAHALPEMQSRIAKQIQAQGLICYYQPEMVRQVAPWSKPYPLLRIHHSVDAEMVRPLLQDPRERRPALVSGALAFCYPIREAAFRNAARLGLDTIRHPGYGNRGTDTPNYLRRISGYKVHLATASVWSYALRKIIESVACGVAPVTNLPAEDVLPEIDGALIRLPAELVKQFPKQRGPSVPVSPIALNRLRDIIRDAVSRWDRDERMFWAEKALRYYDWRVSGERLSNLMTASMTCSA